MLILSLDIGKKKTGVAYGNNNPGFILALDTIHHQNEQELMHAVLKIIAQKKIEQIVVGLPRLLSGKEGEQAKYVKNIAISLRERSRKPVKLIDERLTTQKISVNRFADPDAKSACSILEIFLSQREIDK